jgi:hypothetical protein
MSRKRPTRAELLDALDNACDVAVWMSGSDDFAPEGKAGRYWAEDARPRLFAALDACRRERELRPAPIEDAPK